MPPQTHKDMTLGDFVKYLSALLQKGGIKMPFKNERAWHLAFYELKTKRQALGRPEFFDSLVFDWDGTYPKSQKLSEFLHALHWNSSVTAGNPSYELIALNDEMRNLWLKPVEDLDAEAREFFNTAVGVAQHEFAAQ